MPNSLGLNCCLWEVEQLCFAVKSSNNYYATVCHHFSHPYMYIQSATAFSDNHNYLIWENIQLNLKGSWHSLVYRMYMFPARDYHEYHNLIIL